MSQPAGRLLWLARTGKLTVPAAVIGGRRTDACLVPAIVSRVSRSSPGFFSCSPAARLGTCDWVANGRWPPLQCDYAERVRPSHFQVSSTPGAGAASMCPAGAALAPSQKWQLRSLVASVLRARLPLAADRDCAMMGRTHRQGPRQSPRTTPPGYQYGPVRNTVPPCSARPRGECTVDGGRLEGYLLSQQRPTTENPSAGT
jgi:hypothetical protein